MSNESYMSDAEIDALQTSGLDRNTPYAIQDVSRSQFSVARHYGFCKFNGAEYVYFVATDELIREDVLAWLSKHRNENRQ